MLTVLKQKVSLKWKIRMQLFFLQFKSINQLPFKTRTRNKKRIYIFLAADYGNLGDVAITYAQHKFLSANFPEYEVTEIPISKTLAGLSFVARTIQKEDVVTTVGGGNMGDLYSSIELFRQLVLSYFKDNKIISFPQTIDFSETEAGKNALKKTVRMYGKHSHLTLVAREQKSYDFFKDNFPKNTVLLTPDIVLSLDRSVPAYNRSGALICLRDDKEKKMSETEENSLLSLLESKYTYTRRRDTHVGGKGLSLKNRVTQLTTIWEDFKKAELVVTDRLHGMIFCYITGTPVLVFLNNNHKIQSSYYWIKDAPHVKLIENYDELPMKINELKNCVPRLDLTIPNEKYEALKNSIPS